jgi:hypothetical protein
MRGSEFELPPGDHNVRIEAAGFEAFVDTVTIATGERLQLRYAATRAIAQAQSPTEQTERPTPVQAAAPEPGVLRVGISPRALLIINDQRLGERRRHVDTLPPGEYALRLESEGYVSKDTTVTVISNDTTTVIVRLTRIQP